MGLHGKSFIPLIMGFGCNVPAVMATAPSRAKVATGDDAHSAYDELRGSYTHLHHDSGYLFRP
jgi:hypothetical protein